MSSLHISISAEPIFHVGQVAITNSILTSWIVSALLIILAITASKTITHTRRPKGLQNVLEAIIEGLQGLVFDITQSKAKAREFFPIIATFFLFIWLNNWFGLLPGVGTIGILEETTEAEHAYQTESVISPAYAHGTEIHGTAVLAAEEAHPEEPAAETHEVVEATETHEAVTPEKTTKFVPLLRAGTADLNTTLALALISVIFTQYIGFKYLGLSYLTKFFNFKQGPIYTFVGLLELVSEFAKILSFAFRLFGNIFAGEVLLAVIAFIVPIIAPIPFLGLEVFVGFVQALVFAMLSLVFMSMATHAHGGEEH
jgi:F-type H+-transporting ATPase subunit a